METPRFRHCETKLIHKFDKWLNGVTCSSNMARDVFANIDKIEGLLHEAELLLSTYSGGLQLERTRKSITILADAISKANCIGSVVIVGVVLEVRKNLHLCQIEQLYSRTG